MNVSKKIRINTTTTYNHWDDEIPGGYEQRNKFEIGELVHVSRTCNGRTDTYHVIDGPDSIMDEGVCVNNETLYYYDECKILKIGTDHIIVQ